MVGTEVAHYFIDEAGCFTLFNKRGVLVIGQEGVSRCLMLGMAIIPDPGSATRQLNTLRQSLLADPYFKGVPSFQPAAKKTAVCFHAKDDLPEVRREVFKLLPTLGAKVQVAVRRKDSLAKIARALKDRGSRLTDESVYDSLVSRLVKNSLHKPAEVRIRFAKRGKSEREAALVKAVERGRKNFQRTWKVEGKASLVIDCGVPSDCCGLQIVDYYLWSLQRLYERNEDRYFESVADQLSLIMDLDDDRENEYGTWYTKKKRLTLETLKPVAG